MNLAQQVQKIKRFSQLNLPFRFDNQTVSSNVTYSYVEAFKSIINFKGLIATKVSYQKPNNARFSTVDIIDYLVDATILGCSRFMHMDDLRQDQVFQQIKGSELPSEKVCRDLLKALPTESLDELRELNKELLAIQARNEDPREVMLDFDDTVCTVFGNQEGAECGYNPRYHGRPSFKEKVGMLAQTHELLNLTLESGKHHSNHEFLDFFKDCINMLPASWYLKRIRADRGFFDQKTLEYCEENGYEYVIKAKMQKGVKKILDYVNENPEQYPWTSISKVFSVTEITVPLPAWSKARRFILIRKSLPKSNDKQLTLFDEFAYEYQAIVTNIDYMTPEEIFHDYNQRCNVENKIDELKQGFAFDQNSQTNYKCNELFMLIKMIAYNLHNWFKRGILPLEVRHHEMPTIRRIFYKAVGNIVGNGRYRHIRFAPNKLLEKLISHIHDFLKHFRKVVIL